MYQTETNKKIENKQERRKIDTAKFEIEGMHCDGCAQIVRSLLKRKTGVTTAIVSFSNGAAEYFRIIKL